MDGLEIIIGSVITLWFGSIEWRMRNFVNKDRFSDLIARIDKIDEKIDILLERL